MDRHEKHQGRTSRLYGLVFGVMLKSMNLSGTPAVRFPHWGRLLVFFLGLIICIATGYGQAVTPDRQKELRERFLQGKQLVDQKRYLAALDIFKSILQEDPQARGSLLMSGLAYNQLHMFSTASDHFERFLELEPDHLAGNMGALKAYQSSGKSEQALRVRKKLLELQRAGKNPRFQILLSFEREVRKLPNGKIISVQEAFPGKEMYVWKLLLLKKDMTSIDRAIEWKQADSDQKEIMGMDHGEELWILGEPVYQSGELKEYKIRKMHTGPLSYPQAVDYGVKILEQ